jgi:acetyl esterase/lipase
VIIVGSNDELVVESKAMADAMKRTGIEHELHIMEQMPHAFLQMGELSSCKEGFRLIFDFLQKHS